MQTPLFDRFETDKKATLDSLARDIADILGARRGRENNLPGILSWGLPSMMGLTPAVNKDRLIVANFIQEALEKFEPRLENVNVNSIEGSADFSFQLEAELVTDDDNEEVTFSILSPRRGGALGADVKVVEMY